MPENCGFHHRSSATEVFDFDDSGGHCHRERQRCRTQMVGVFSVNRRRWEVNFGHHLSSPIIDRSPPRRFLPTNRFFVTIKSRSSASRTGGTNECRSGIRRAHEYGGTHGMIGPANWWHTRDFHNWVFGKCSHRIGPLWMQLSNDFVTFCSTRSCPKGGCLRTCRRKVKVKAVHQLLWRWSNENGYPMHSQKKFMANDACDLTVSERGGLVESHWFSGWSKNLHVFGLACWLCINFHMIHVLRIYAARSWIYFCMLGVFAWIAARCDDINRVCGAVWWMCCKKTCGERILSSNSNRYFFTYCFWTWDAVLEKHLINKKLSWTDLFHLTASGRSGLIDVVARFEMWAFNAVKRLIENGCVRVLYLRSWISLISRLVGNLRKQPKTIARLGVSVFALQATFRPTPHPPKTTTQV